MRFIVDIQDIVVQHTEHDVELLNSAVVFVIVIAFPARSPSSFS